MRMTLTMETLSSEIATMSGDCGIYHWSYDYGTCVHLHGNVDDHFFSRPIEDNLLRYFFVRIEGCYKQPKPHLYIESRDRRLQYDDVQASHILYDYTANNTGKVSLRRGSAERKGSRRDTVYYSSGGIARSSAVQSIEVS